MSETRMVDDIAPMHPAQIPAFFGFEGADYVKSVVWTDGAGDVYRGKLAKGSALWEIRRIYRADIAEKVDEYLSGCGTTVFDRLLEHGRQSV